MKPDLKFDFSVDEENHKVLVQREFAAPVSEVWAAWTQQELLDQWWAPAPWKTETESMEFKEGGQWTYSMLGPNGERHYSKANYGPIVEKESFSTLDSFCDEKGKVDPDLPRSEWKVEFKDKGETTLVTVEIQHESSKDMKQNLEMGFREGFTMALGNLDKLLEKTNSDSEKGQASTQQE